MAGIEELDEEEIEELKEDAKEAIQAVEEGTATPAEHEEAQQAVANARVPSAKADPAS